MREDPQPSVESISDLQLVSLSISRNSWMKDSKWKAEASLRKGSDYTGTTSLTLTLTDDVAEKIMRLLSPVIVASASQEAQALANQAKKLAEAVGQKMLEGLK